MEKKDNIYVYLWEELNAVYVGRTINPKSRHYQHKHISTERTYKFSEEHCVEHPKMIIIENDLSLENGIEREKYWIEYYKKRAYNVINKTKGGQIGKILKLTEEERKKIKDKCLEKQKDKTIEYNKKYYEKNKEKIKNRIKKWYENHKNEKKIIDKLYRERHKEKIKRYNKSYKEIHKNELKLKMKNYRDTHKEEMKSYRIENKEKIDKQNKEYRSVHKEERNKKQKEYYQKHKEKYKEYAKIRYKNSKVQKTIFFLKKS